MRQHATVSCYWLRALSVLLFFQHYPVIASPAASRSVLGVAPEVSIRPSHNPGTFGDKDVVFVLFTPGWPHEATDSQDGTGLAALMASGQGLFNDHFFQFPLIAKAALLAFKEQTVFEAGPTEWSGYNFVILHADTCPDGPSSMRCGHRYALRLLTDLFINHGSKHPKPIAAIGGTLWGSRVSGWLSAMSIPTVSHWLGDASFDSRYDYPYFLRTGANWGDVDAAMIEIASFFNYTTILIITGNEAQHTSAGMLSDALDKGMTVELLRFSPGPHSIELPPEGGWRRQEWDSVVDKAKAFNAHCILFQGGGEYPWLQFLAYFHYRGLVGSGYLWVHWDVYAWSWVPVMEFFDLVGWSFDHISREAQDGAIGIEKSEKGPLWHAYADFLLELKRRRANDTDIVEDWIMNEIEKSTSYQAHPDRLWESDPLDYPGSKQHLFDGLYATLWAANDLLVEHSGMNFDSKVLLEKIWDSDFDGAGGRVAFNTETGSRKSDLTIVQFQPACDDSGQRTLSLVNGEYVPQVADLIPIGLYSRYAQAGQSTVIDTSRLVFYNCSRDVPPDKDLLCSEGEYYVRQEGRCHQCEVGRFSSSTGQSECLECTPGTFGSRPGLAICEVCRSGEFTNQQAATACQACEPGRYQDLVQQGSCKECDEGTFSSNWSSIACQLCPEGEFSNTSGADACFVCKDGHTTETEGKDSASECACQAGQVEIQGACTSCPEGMSCAFGSSLDAWLSRSRQRNASTGVYPELLPGFWASVDAPLEVYRCEGAARCPGGDPGACASTLTKQSCSRCRDEEWWDSRACRKCKVDSTDAWMFPYIPILVTPLVLVVMYQLHNSGLKQWRSWMQSLSDFLFVAMNHSQVMALLGEANVALPPTTDDTNEAWAWMLDWLSLFRIECAGYTGVQSKVLLQTFAPMLLGLWTIVLYLTFKGVSLLLGKPELQMRFGRMFNVVMSIIFSFFTAVIAMTLLLYKCDSNPNGSASLRADRSVNCYEAGGAWSDMLAISIFAVVFYCGGMAVLFVWAIVAARKYFKSLDFQLRWKFLFVRYRLNAWWWSMSFLGKNVLFNAALVITDSGLGQLYLMMAILCLYLIMVVIFLPYRAALANFIEILSCLAAVGTASMLTHFDPNVHKHSTALDNLSTSLGIIPLLFAVLCAAGVILRHGKRRLTASSGHANDEADAQLKQRLLAASAVVIDLVGSSTEAMKDFIGRLDELDRQTIKQMLIVLEAELLGVSHMRLSSAAPATRSSRVESFVKSVVISQHVAPVNGEEVVPTSAMDAVSSLEKEAVGTFQEGAVAAPLSQVLCSDAATSNNVTAPEDSQPVTCL